MKVRIYGGEAFPVYQVNYTFKQDNKNIIDIPAEKLKEWSKICKDFLKFQEEIVSILEKENIEYWATHNCYKVFCIDEDDIK